MPLEYNPTTHEMFWTKQHKDGVTFKTTPIIYSRLLWRDDLNMGWIIDKHGWFPPSSYSLCQGIP